MAEGTMINVIMLLALFSGLGFGIMLTKFCQFMAKKEE